MWTYTLASVAKMALRFKYHEARLASLNMKPIKIEGVLNYLDWEYSQMCFVGNRGGGYEVLG